MGSFLLKRILATIPVMIIVAIIVFTLIRLVPGDPAAVIAGNMATNEDIARIRTELGLDRGIFVQLGLWSQGLLQGDLGQSFFFKKQVVELIGDRLEPTLSLAVLTIVITVPVALVVERLGSLGSPDRLESLGPEFLGRVTSGYNELVSRPNTVGVHGVGTPIEVAERIWAAVEGLF